MLDIIGRQVIKFDLTTSLLSRLINILALTTEDLPLNYIRLVLEEVFRIASSLTSCSFCHTKRSLNVPAHELGQFVLISGLENIWVGECPEAIALFVLSDIY